MSGVGTKAGGPDYLLHFMDPRVVTENTMRRGFAPIEEDDDWMESAEVSRLRPLAQPAHI
jgi:RHH-type proline utilization regulon transcriptional repressor/proline dehydrogenase/delta 1-pyrroline-5-carboxylate dehydrogenase